MSKAIKSLGGHASASYTIAADIPIIVGYDGLSPEEGSNLEELDKTRYKVDPAFVKNIAAVGVLKRGRVRIVDGRILVVDGRRRLIHLRAANELRAVDELEALEFPFDLEKGGDAPDARITMVSANCFNMEVTHIGQARNIKAMKEAGLDAGDIANAHGFSKSTVANRLKLLDLPAPVIRFVERGELTSMAALEYHGRDDVNSVVEEAKTVVSAGGGAKGQVNRSRATSAQAGTGSDAHKPPTRKFLEKMQKTEAWSDLDVDVKRVIRWVTGDLKTPPSTVKDCAREASKKPLPPTNRGGPTEEENESDAA
jgi:ParB-like chromosome segregation protein Spo0J